MKVTYYIVAENYEQFNNWCLIGRPKELIPEWFTHNVDLFYVNHVSQLRGLSDIKGFYLPGCENRPDYQQILDMINIIKFKQYNAGYNITGVILDEIGE